VGQEGVEGYLYPFQVFHDLRASFRIDGSNKRIEGYAIAQRVKVTPSEVVRLYASDGLRARETLFVPIDQPALMIFFEVQSESPIHIEVSFRPDLDLMWPAGIGGQSYSWDDIHHAFRIDEPSGAFHALIGSPNAIAHSDPMDRSDPWNLDRRLSFEVLALPHKVVLIVATIGLPKSYDAPALYARALTEYPSWREQADAHYQAVLKQRLQIATGEAEIDQALAWTTVALDQAEACNPDLGCGLVAGYGPTWPVRRPQYAWFFAGDGLLTASALEAEGAHDEVERELTFLRRYQNAATGAVWHEISQSAAYVDWFHIYPFIYRHTDISPLYLLTMRNIWRASGDRQLLQTSWPSLEAAWHFCVAHLDTEDGLIVIPPNQSGVNENEADRTAKELPLEMVWAAGAEAFSDLANAAAKQSLAEEAHRAAEKAKASLSKFWDSKRKYYFEGLLAGGRPFLQETASPVWGVSERLFPLEEREAVLNRLAEPAFLTPWGLRSIPIDAPNYQPDSYQHGSVWPITTANYVLAALEAHRPQQAWPMWRALVEQSFLESPGHLPEVLSGASYRVLNIAVPEQTWSSAALMTSTVRGILGLEPNAPNGELRFEPHLPPQWTQVTISNFQLGDRNLQFNFRRSSTEIDLSLINDGSPFTLEFAPMLPARAKVTGLVNGNAVSTTLRQEDQDMHAVTKIKIGKNSEVRLLLTPEK
jgi:glycogen debranching enzyme